MPELPEVETVARTLAPLIAGRSIAKVRLLHPQTLQGPLPLEALQGLRIDAENPTSRRGKLLFVHGSHAPTSEGAQTIQGFAVHLKMTGRLFVHPAETPLHAHTRVHLLLDDGSQLFFDDARKFGYLRVISPQSLQDWAFLQKLGPEPLEIGPKDFAALFAGKKGKIKSLLLDQAILAGCGNIYADEALFRARIAPHMPAHHLQGDQLAHLHAALQSVLRESIAACGSSIRDYRTARGDVGAFQNAFAVYNRAGQACIQCGTVLEKIQVAGRGTVYCPHCQPCVFL